MIYYACSQFIYYNLAVLQVSGEPVISSTEEHQPPYYDYVEENIYLIDK